MTTASWAQAADVLTYTGTSVTDAQVMQAQAIVDMFSARTYDAAARIGTRDLHWLKLAVAYQARWIVDQPDLFSRLDYATVPGASRPAEIKDDALLIAPLAKRALRRVSWLRSRSLHVRSAFTDGPGGLSPNPDAEGNDAYETWTGF